MPTSKPRVMLTLNEDTHALLASLAEQTKMSISAIVGKLLGAHVADLYEYDAWLKDVGTAPIAARGRNLLHNYGPDTLTEAIQKLDPSYRSRASIFEDELRDANSKPGGQGGAPLGST